MGTAAPTWAVWLFGGGTTFIGGLALAVIAREARIVRGHRDLGGDDD